MPQRHGKHGQHLGQKHPDTSGHWLQAESTEGEDCLPSTPLLPTSFLGLKGFLWQKFPGEEEGLSMALSRPCWKRMKEDDGQWTHLCLGSPELCSQLLLCLK